MILLNKLLVLLMLIQKTEEEAISKTTFTEITELIDKIVWPLAVVVILLIYKKYLAGVISRVGSFSANASGISMTFQDKLDQLPKSVKLLTKSGVQVAAQSPNDQLRNIKSQMEADIKNLATNSGIDTTSLTMSEIFAQLKDKGKLTNQKSKAFTALYELAGSTDPGISQSQVDQVKLMVSDLDL
jgi:hypothetical protein